MRRLQEQIVELNRHSYYVGPRDPDRNRSFKGDYMVCEVETLSEPPSDDSSASGYCIVGENLTELVQTAYDDVLADHF